MNREGPEACLARACFWEQLGLSPKVQSMPLRCPPREPSLHGQGESRAESQVLREEAACAHWSVRATWWGSGRAATANSQLETVSCIARTVSPVSGSQT